MPANLRDLTGGHSARVACNGAPDGCFDLKAGGVGRQSGEVTKDLGEEVPADRRTLRREIHVR